MIDSFETLAGAYSRAKSAMGARFFAPDGAIDKIINDQKNAYYQFISSLENSYPEERQYIIEKVFNSNNLTNNVKLAIVIKSIQLLDSYPNKSNDRNKKM